MGTHFWDMGGDTKPLAQYLEHIKHHHLVVNIVADANNCNNSKKLYRFSPCWGAGPLFQRQTVGVD